MFSLKHFAETFQTKSLFKAIFSVYWFRKHCLHYTFMYSVLCISQNLLKRKKFQKGLRNFVKVCEKICDFIRRLKKKFEGRKAYTAQDFSKAIFLAADPKLPCKSKYRTDFISLRYKHSFFVGILQHLHHAQGSLDIL